MTHGVNNLKIKKSSIFQFQISFFFFKKQRVPCVRAHDVIIPNFSTFISIVWCVVRVLLQDYDTDTSGMTINVKFHQM